MKLAFSRLACASALLLLGPLVSLAVPLNVTHDQAIAPGVFEDLVRFTKYSSAAYQAFCPRPLGNTLVQGVSSMCFVFSSFGKNNISQLVFAG